MILIFGGAYQGKLEYAKANFEVNRVCVCGGTADGSRGEFAPADGSRGEFATADGSRGEFATATPDFSADVICGIENFVLDCVEKGLEAREYFEKNKQGWQDKILVITDTSQGVVPVEKNLRDFREMNGRLLLYLAGEADRVIRVFCGIGKDIK